MPSTACRPHSPCAKIIFLGLRELPAMHKEHAVSLLTASSLTAGQVGQQVGTASSGATLGGL